MDGGWTDEKKAWRRRFVIRSELEQMLMYRFVSALDSSRLKPYTGIMKLFSAELKANLAPGFHYKRYKTPKQRESCCELGSEPVSQSIHSHSSPTTKFCLNHVVEPHLCVCEWENQPAQWSHHPEWKLAL